ncbi:glycerol-3-phosphate acyltransferase [candidate division WWE3 bacterium]|uniref:Glycerol-3-phosphate acyltransferase n=1 Tax=candidate division WWE3 bacterium TaxID=2053526 RepID=A0A955RW73_UNCKA|nr:glycerol-3-phosphate acyltransferase [candidate division WWE3 bacterium]
MNEWLAWILILLCSYTIGVIPFGWVVARIKNTDIISHGSGKIGFTNVWRILGLKYALPILVLDTAKGIFVIWLATIVEDKYSCCSYLKLIAVLLVLAGHSWSPILRIYTGKWHGGRSVATGMGVALVICWQCLLIGLSGLVLTLVTGYMSLGVLVSIFLVCCLAALYSLQGSIPSQDLLVMCVAAVFLYLRHISSIRRLLSGAELKIFRK